MLIDKEGTINTVSGYFTVGVLSYLKKLYNESVDEFKFLLGDIASTENSKERAIDKTISDNENFETWEKWIFENKPETQFQLENFRWRHFAKI